MTRYTETMVERLRELAAFGHGGNAISRTLSDMAGRTITAESVRKKAAALGVRLRKPPTNCEARTAVNRECWAVLLRAADARGVSVARLCRQLIETCCKAHLIGAVLDDGAPLSAPRDPSRRRPGRPRVEIEARA